MASTEKIVDWQTAQQLVNSWKGAGETVVFTNGCFDILHAGHIDYLEKARALGHRLIIGLNTDASVSRFKGPDRPVQDEFSRARILAALEFVDAVVLFNEDTPLKLISTLIPNILVKGSDYLAENIVGADVVKSHGGEVKTISFLAGYSTSKIIDRIKRQ
ncbi:MAG TPA: D-glycero-beta-D-manno-heptose 1-phosphate adenylyltransferase [Cyclobacteriaceae bacterium]|nr:D-glycero-beta-D-manno-heptose 1-phosphate adenylyltransferase [Cyclobacteriaceae bacterium]